MHPFLTQLRHEIQSLALRGKRILIGVSGGADSVALLRGMCDCRAPLRIELYAAHLNHRLRGTAADEDAAWIRQICDRWQVPLDTEALDVAALARESGVGLEEAARTARYRFLEQTALTRSAGHLAVAHSADDQAETILHHILRGTGLAGLQGMPQQRVLPSGVVLVRPMLSIGRSEILDYLHSLGQDFREDASNASEAYTRNRIRHTLLPTLSADYNPQIHEALRRLGRQAGEAQAAIETLAAKLLDASWEQADLCACRVDCGRWSDEPRHLLREAMTLIWRRQAWPRQKMAFDHWDRLIEIGLNGGAASLPGGVSARRVGQILHLERREPA